MKIMIAAAGALALTTAAASAQTMRGYGDAASSAPTAAETEVYYEVESPSAATSYQFEPYGSSTAPGFSPQNDTEALDTTPNMGAGTSRTSNANSG